MQVFFPRKKWIRRFFTQHFPMMIKLSHRWDDQLQFLRILCCFMARWFSQMHSLYTYTRTHRTDAWSQIDSNLHLDGPKSLENTEFWLGWDRFLKARIELIRTSWVHRMATLSFPFGLKSSPLHPRQGRSCGCDSLGFQLQTRERCTDGCCR